MFAYMNGVIKITKYVRNTKNFFPPEPKKLTQHHNCMVWYPKYISSTLCKTKTYFLPEPKTAQLEKKFLQPMRRVGRFLQPTRSEYIIKMWIFLLFFGGNIVRLFFLAMSTTERGRNLGFSWIPELSPHVLLSGLDGEKEWNLVQKRLYVGTQL